MERARRGPAPRRTGHLRHLRPRQRLWPGTGARGGRGPLAELPPAEERAGDGARGGRLCAQLQPALDAGVHGVHRSRVHEPVDGGGHRHRQPRSGPPAAVRHVRQPPPGPGHAGAGARPRGRSDGERRVPAAERVLRPDHSPGAADRLDARGDGCAPRSRRDGRDNALPAPGRPVRGLRLPSGALRATHLARGA